MPAVHTYRERPKEVQAIQVHPSAKSVDLTDFCPALTYNHENGIVFPQTGRPHQKLQNGAWFFRIEHHRGCLYDWIVKDRNGDFEVWTEAQFATYFEAV